MTAAVSHWSRVSFILLTNMCVVWAKVSKELPPECEEFFYLGAPPKGLEHQSTLYICQYYNKRARFVTLYQTVQRTPVYSAYTYKRSAGEVCADVPWMYEPQLSRPGATREMQLVLDEAQGTRQEQADLSDYSNAALYERATLNPDVHQDHPDDKASTYTLTNTVPLVPAFVDQVWTAQEQVIRMRLNNYCRGPAFVVTGVGGSGREMRGEGEGVAVPALLWSAYCCPRFDHGAPVSVRYKFPAFAHYGRNAEEDNEVVEVSVRELQEVLESTMLVEQNIHIFEGDCARTGDS
uniref:Endonuclease domain-containing 1 protein-like n=1 Tax=Neogobius melanostomus TaxID=47308 RepID=A0A8C6UJS0_9GOBI